MFHSPQKKQWPNGLTVVFEKNTAAEVVSLNMGIKLGAVFEADVESGLCHVIEHMVFKGTQSFQAGEIAVLVEAHGGELNAYTSFDQTVYYINLPSRHFSLGLKILKEMVFDATMDSVELEREKEVVIEEIRRGKDNPMRVLSELLFSHFFKIHNYRRPVIGTEKHVRNFTRDQVTRFYKKHYSPQNMILGVCGAIDELELERALQEHFSFDASVTPVSQKIVMEPPHEKSQIVMKSMDIQATYFDIGFSCPGLTHDDVPALDMLSHLLGESSTSLLEKFTHEEEQLVHSIYTSCYTPKYPGLFVIGGMVDPKKINMALASIRRQIDTARHIPFDDESLERAKTLMKAQMVFDKETCEGTARKWMVYETVMDDFAYDEKYIEKIQKLTTHDLLRVAQKYLNPSLALLAVLHAPRVKIKIDRAFFKPEDKTKKNLIKKKKQSQDVTLHTLSNGIRVLVKENHRLPIAALKLTSLGGLRYETISTNGLSYLMANSLTKGTEKQSYLEIAEKCERHAVSISGYAGRNSWGGSLSFLSDKIKEACDLFADVILHPAFAKDEVKKERDLQLESIKNKSDSAAQIAFYLALEKLYANHPYRFQLLGHREKVKTFHSPKLQQFYEHFCVPENLVMAVVGGVNTSEVLELLDREFGKLKKKKFHKKKLKSPLPLKKQILLFESKNKNQAHVVVGFLGASLYDKDRSTLDVINSLLSGQGGRLFLELRDKQSLAYSVSSTMIEGLETGYFGIHMDTDPGKVQKAVDGIFAELDKLKKDSLSETELDRAKNYIIGNYEIDHQKNDSIAMQLALNEVYNIDIPEFFNFASKIRKVTAEDVSRVAKRIIHFDQSVVSVVGPKGCRPKL